MAALNRRDPFAGLPLRWHDRQRLLAHYKDAEPYARLGDMLTWRLDDLQQLMIRGEAHARALARRGAIHAAARWQKTADEAGEALRILMEQTPARSGIRLTHAPVWG